MQVNQYDHYLRGYQAAAIQTERLAAVLNAGQSIILSAGMLAGGTACILGRISSLRGTSLFSLFSPLNGIMLYARPEIKKVRVSAFSCRDNGPLSSSKKVADQCCKHE